MNDERKPYQEDPFTREEERELQTLFKHARQADHKHSVKVNNSEIEAAYQVVKSRTKNGSSISYFRYAAAAILLIGLIALGMVLFPNSVQVPNGSTRAITLADGTTVTLNSGSSLTYPRWFNIWGRNVDLEGEAFFDVTENGDPFRIETQNAVITVMGTAFNVRSRPEEARYNTSVFLKEGKVSLASKTDRQKAVILKPGEISILAGNQISPNPPRQIDPSKATAWLQNGLSFIDQPLKTIFDEIGRRYNVEIESENEQLLRETLTIYLSEMKGAEQTLADICSAKNMQYVKKGDTFIISRK